jgi:hypothetical protein
MFLTRSYLSIVFFFLICVHVDQFEPTLIVSTVLFVAIGLIGLFGMISLADDAQPLRSYMIANAVFRYFCPFSSHTFFSLLHSMLHFVRVQCGWWIRVHGSVLGVVALANVRRRRLARRLCAGQAESGGHFAGALNIIDDVNACP